QPQLRRRSFPVGFRLAARCVAAQRLRQAGLNDGPPLLFGAQRARSVSARIVVSERARAGLGILANLRIAVAHDRVGLLACSGTGSSLNEWVELDLTKWEPDPPDQAGCGSIA